MGRSPDGHWFSELTPHAHWTADASGSALQFSPRWLNWTGLSHEDAAPDGWGLVSHPDDLPLVRAAWDRSIQDGQPYDLEHRMRLAGGTYRWMRSRAFPRKNAQGEILGWIGSTEDIEDRKQAQLALAQSERIYRAIGESIAWGIWICEPNGRNIYASDSILRLIGMTQQQCSDFGWIQALHPDDAQRVESAWKECVRSEGDWDQEFRYRGTDGCDYPVLVRGVPVRNEKNEIVCWAGINLDIRRLKEATAELEHQAGELRDANQQLEQFAFSAAHDLQEHNRTVNIYTQLLLRAGDPDQRQHYGQLIQDASGRMERLVQALLRFARVRSEEMQIGPVRADEALEDALQACQASLYESQAQVVAAPLPCVHADEYQLSLIFQNLLSNAVKYRRPDLTPRITITAEPLGPEQTVIAVRDNGIGFPQDQADRIFMAFQRLHAKSVYPGTGLGLAITKRAVERLGGRLWAESRPGEGSTFFIALKRA